jgi:hypothetical protein
VAACHRRIAKIADFGFSYLKRKQDGNITEYKASYSMGKFDKWYDVHKLAVSVLYRMLRYVREKVNYDAGPSVDSGSLAMLQFMTRTNFSGSDVYYELPTIQKYHQQGQRLDKAVDALWEAAKEGDWTEEEYKNICTLLDGIAEKPTQKVPFPHKYGFDMLFARAPFEQGVCTTPYDFLRSTYCESLRVRPVDATPQNTENMMIDAFRRAMLGKGYNPMNTNETQARGNAGSVRDAGMDADDTKCAVCPREAVFACGDCHNRFYCSDSCAFADWAEGHATFCGL